MSKAAALIMCGGGHLDGSELLEASSCLIAASEVKFDLQIFAPNIEFKSIDHKSRKPTNENRNALVESARLARGKVKSLEELNASDFDALILPGGSGFAQIMTCHQSNWSQESLLPAFQKVVNDFFNQQKPILAVCISPVLVALALKGKRMILSTGADSDTRALIEANGHHYEECRAGDFISDRDNRVVSTPAYMISNTVPAEVFKGIQKATRELFEMS